MKLIEIKNIYESRNTKINNLHWTGNKQKFITTFIDSLGDTYEIRLVNLSSNDDVYKKLKNAVIYDIQFSILQNGARNISQTNKGNSMEILSIIQNAIIDKFINENVNPDVISMVASNDPNDNTPEQLEKRKRLYYIFAKQLSKELGFPYVYPNIVGKIGVATLMCKIELTPSDLSYISYMVKHKITN